MKILCDTHSHTVASTHAYSTVHDYWQIAAQKGMQLFSITDHGPAMPDAPHPWHFGNMKVLPRVHNNIALLRGIEANILLDGTLDIPVGMVPFLDFAVASFHEPVFEPSDKKSHTKAMISAIETGLCQIVGHPGNPNYPIDHEEVIRAAKDNNVLIEINNSSFTHSRKGSEKQCSAILEAVLKLDWKVTFSSDAHIAFDVGDVSRCVQLAESLSFPEDKVVDANANRFLAFLAEHDKAVSLELADWAEQFR
ncbi:phosphatase [Motiliproteus sp. MSK22-1]|uniref:phosphatase n=1 Tax=Motiliproteus sp. MSK22-1 TaxID=1897630 RepID=UPI000975A08D|nr:phosphatase [Motiliproteus sp. MSK22-1]OMH32773.1 phosphatase [Motiliproteus sp. MSK22-1]